MLLTRDSPRATDPYISFYLTKGEVIEKMSKYSSFYLKADNITVTTDGLCYGTPFTS